MNRLFKRSAQWLKKRGRMINRNQRVKPLKRAQADGWTQLDRQNANAYWTQSQGVR